MAMISSSHDRDCRVDRTPAVSLFRSLGDPTRLAIVHEFAKGERRVVDLTRHLGLAQSTISAHLALMRDSGIVESRPLGRQSLYRLSRPELFTVLTAAESMLAASGTHVELCPPNDASSYEARPIGTARPAVAGTGNVCSADDAGAASDGSSRRTAPTDGVSGAAPVVAPIGLARKPAHSAGVAKDAAA